MRGPSKIKSFIINVPEAYASEFAAVLNKLPYARVSRQPAAVVADRQLQEWARNKDVWGRGYTVLSTRDIQTIWESQGGSHVTSMTLARALQNAGIRYRATYPSVTTANWSRLWLFSGMPIAEFEDMPLKRLKEIYNGAVKP